MTVVGLVIRNAVRLGVGSKVAIWSLPACRIRVSMGAIWSLPACRILFLVVAVWGLPARRILLWGLPARRILV